MAEVTTPTVCPMKTCKAGASDPYCYTTTGYRRGKHKVRLDAEAGRTRTARPRSKRPSDAGFRALDAALSNGGLLYMSNYQHHGDAQRRQTMLALADRGWIELVERGQHDDTYRITDDGRAAHGRYERWMESGS